MEQLGQKVIKVKTRVLQRVGEHLQRCGVRQVGHGRVVLAGNNAEESFVRCGEYIENLIASGNPLAAETIVELFKIQGTFNSQILASGEAHIKADRLPEHIPSEGHARQAFPPGGAVIDVHPPQQKPTASLPPPLP